MKRNDAESPGTIVYPIGDTIYINLTNKCTNRCIFCVRDRAAGVAGYDLRLRRDPTPREVCDALQPYLPADVVYCGFGEPTINLPALVRSAELVQTSGGTVRVNTNGHGNIINGRSIAHELADVVDEVSISINAPDPETYAQITRCAWGAGTFSCVQNFAEECRRAGIAVTLTAVDVITDEALARCAELASFSDCAFRVRPFVP